MMELLREHHERITLTLTEAAGLLAGSEPLYLIDIARLRWRLMRELRSYQLFKHNEVFRPLIAARDGISSQAAQEMKSRCLALSEAYVSHVKRWTFDEAVANPEEFHRESSKIVQRIKLHLIDEWEGVGILLRDLAINPPRRHEIAGGFGTQ